jgi:hypothetical protein
MIAAIRFVMFAHSSAGHNSTPIEQISLILILSVLQKTAEKIQGLL